MKRFVFAVGVLAMAYGAATPARADYAVAKFADGWCRVWFDTANAPVAGKFLWWKHHHHWYYKFPTWDGAHKHLDWAVKWHRCKG
jgi:hypothetical protein